MAFGCADGLVRVFLCDPDPALAAAGRGGRDGDASLVALEIAATLDGHTGWVRDLAFVADVEGGDRKFNASGDAGGGGGLLLASASQDKSTRIWRVAYAEAKGSPAAATAVAEEEDVPAFMRLAAPPRPPAALLAGGRLSVHLEALLVGHEDWVLSVAWQPRNLAPSAAAAAAAAAGCAPVGVRRRPALLTASMDRSLVLWTPSDSCAGGGAAAAGGGGTVWMATASMGEAAASCLGFYGAGFDRTGSRVLAHSHGGALHLWRRERADVDAKIGGSLGGSLGLSVDGASPGESGGRDENGGGGIWTPLAACAGHVSDVTCLAWDTGGRWVLTGSEDLTARLHASWQGGGAVRGWRQLARPQVHGHAIVCLTALPPITAAVPADCDSSNCSSGASGAASMTGSTVFVSGADEKTLRVFDAPGTFLGTLARSLPPSDAVSAAALDAARSAAGESTGAELPQLGLSNKALHGPVTVPIPVPAAVAGAESDANDNDNNNATTNNSTAAPIAADPEAEAGSRLGAGAGAGGGFDDDDTVGSVTPAVLHLPPPEEVLAQATLWPEARKLYGHGNDLECVAAHPWGTLVASACKAQSAGTANIWIWDSARDWRPLGQLSGASLTVVALKFATPTMGIGRGNGSSGGGRDGSGSGGGWGGDMLLAASRDRHVSLYIPPTGAAVGAWGRGGWRLATRVKGHVKAIYDAGWAPNGCDTFATGARDKRVKLWTVTGGGSGSGGVGGSSGGSSGGGGGGGDGGEASINTGTESGVVSAVVSEELPAFGCAVTAVAFAPRRWKGERLVLAVGLEDGRIHVWTGGGRSGGRGGSGSPWAALVSVAAHDCHAAAVRALAWQPCTDGAIEGGGRGGGRDEKGGEDGAGGAGNERRFASSLASCGADHAVRLFQFL
jgi:elongator complex protein 2